jgi:hypothetical protein
LYNILKSAESRADIVRLLATGDLKAKWYLHFMQSTIRPSFTISDYPFSEALSGNYDLMQKAAAANEREAFYRLGLSSFYFDRERRERYFKIGIKLGCKRSMEQLAFLLEFNDPKKWKLLFKARGRFVNSDLGWGKTLNNPCKFIIGKYMRKDPYFKNGEKEYVDFYHFQCRATREAVDTFSLICTRLGIYRDLRILIGKYIWKTRKESQYQ